MTRAEAEARVPTWLTGLGMWGMITGNRDGSRQITCPVPQCIEPATSDGHLLCEYHTLMLPQEIVAEMLSFPRPYSDEDGRQVAALRMYAMTLCLSGMRDE